MAGQRNARKSRPLALLFPLACVTPHDPYRPVASGEGTGATPALVLISEPALVRLCAQLGATKVGGRLSADELALVASAKGEPAWTPEHVQLVVEAIRQGQDPLGTALLELRSPLERRAVGAFYTPASIVDPMVAWVLKMDPARVVDAGCGSGRFATAVARVKPGIELVAVDLDPLATLLTRAALAVLGANDASVIQGDYTRLRLPAVRGRTAFIGNPPYVRHHDLKPSAKRWIVAASQRLGHRASALAGLHAHFFVATAILARDGDVGSFVTSSEWLDVRYGSVVRHLLANGLGGRALHLIKPTAVAFDGTQTTAVVTCFEKGSKTGELTIQLVENTAELSDLDQGRQIDTRALATSNRWTELLASLAYPMSDNQVPLGQLARVSRGIVTGGNDFFVMTRQQALERGIAEWCRPAITDAKEVLQADGTVRDGPERKVVLALPRDFERHRHSKVDAYLKQGEHAARGVVRLCDRYICGHRNPWWHLSGRAAPPIVASYMARQAPAFAHNPDGLLVINIAHGIYPLSAMSDNDVVQLVAKLNNARSSYRGRGRTYQGGLEKFEPREMEALLVQAE